MQGEYIPVTKSGVDGVASWNSTSQTLTILFGGADGDMTVQVNGLDALGLGNTVCVRLDMANWTTNFNVLNTSVACGGDPQTGGYNLYDRNFALDGNGDLAIPVNAVEGICDGYRILITASNAPDVYPAKYEPENATVNHAIHYNTAQASGGGYVGGIDYTDSFVCLHVTMTNAGLYNMFIRYAASSAYDPATHFVSVNGQSQGVVNYLPTAGWSRTEERTTSRLVSLVAGNNDIMLSHATNYAELDFIDVRPDTHRYDAELATNNDVNLGTFNTDGIPNSVGGINNTDSSVTFTVFAPVAGAYLLTVAYANGTGSAATHSLTVNGASAGSVSYISTGGWFGGGWLTGANPVSVRRFSTLQITLKAGLNTIQLGKATGYAELDFINITPAGNLTPATPRLAVSRNAYFLLLDWPAPAMGYALLQISDLTQTNWSNMTNAVMVVGSRNQVNLPISGGNGLFRLYP